MSGRSETDVGNADRFIRQHGKNLRYVVEVGWHVYDGARLRFDPEGHRTRRLAEETATSIFEELKDLTAEQRDRRYVWAKRSCSRQGLAAMMHLAEPHLAVSVAELDADPKLFNCANGTLDLETRTLRPHDRSDLITRCSPVNWDPDAQSPAWREFLNTVVPDTETEHFLQRFCGYTLSGFTTAQALLFLHGLGANGKTTAVEALRFVLGDYAATVPFGALLHDDRRRGSEPSPELARLPGVRMLTAAEPDTGARLSESMVKQLTGGDMIAARHLYKGAIEFPPQFKLWLAGNHKPAVRGQDEGIWRRLMLLPFDAYIPPDKRDAELGAKLRKEAAGILNWMVTGYEEWRKRGLAPPQQVTEAVSDYRDENDPLAGFFDEVVEACDGSAASSELYANYLVWAHEQGRTPVKMQLFGRILGDRGFGSHKTGGRMVRRGLKLREDWLRAHSREKGKDDQDVST